MLFMDGCFISSGKSSIVPYMADSKPDLGVHNSARKRQPERFMLLAHLRPHGGDLTRT